jgi:hypothetical protein
MDGDAMGGMKDLLGDRPYVAPSVAFDGATYAPALDHARLGGQLLAVFDFMQDGAWRTLAEVSAVVGGSEAAVSARLRDLRKEKYGAHEVDRQRIEAGLWKYRLRDKP